MDSNKQRIVIGKACGWTMVPRRNRYLFVDEYAFEKAGNYYGGLNSIPDYLNDLNAMHEAEKIITDGRLRRIYYQTLDEITGDQWNTIVATANQRAEAFLKALGLWEENIQTRPSASARPNKAKSFNQLEIDSCLDCDALCEYGYNDGPCEKHKTK